MKSRTSFFNGTVLKKDLTRFAPLWALYTVFLLILFLSSNRYETVITASSIRDTISTIIIVNLIYGGLCANILFGDLFQSRMCYGLHALPLRRESWFCIHTLAGILFSILPNIAATVLYMVLLQQYWYMALLWLAVAVLSFLFFFGLGVFSVMCAGNRLGMAAVYLIVNFFSVLVYVLIKGVYEPLLYGFEFLSEPFLFFCPVYHLSDNRFLSFHYDYIANRYVNGRIEVFYPEMWWYLIVVAVIGVALLGLALVLYRKRKLEYAGDFLALKALEPVFLIIYTLAFSVFFFVLSSVFGIIIESNYVFMAIGAAVGFFTGQMFLKRTVRVFRKKTLIGFAAFAVTFAVSLVLARVDPLRITWYAPETQQIAYMQVYRDNDRRAYSDAFLLDSPEQIETFRDVHTTLMAERGEKTDGASRLYIHYTLKNGREVIRYYAIDEHTAAYDTLRMHFSDYRYLFNVDSWEQLTSGAFTSLSVDFYEEFLQTGEDTTAEYTMPVAMELNAIDIDDREKLDQFMEALRKDCQAGNVAQAHTFHVGEQSVAWCYLSAMLRNEEGIIISNGERFRELILYPCATHTMAVLEQWLAEPQN